MSDSINREKALVLVKDVCNAILSCCDSHYDEEIGGEVYSDIREVDAILKCNKEIRIAIKNIPSAQPERKTGRWIYGEDDSGQDGWTCSECGFFVPWYYDYYGLNNIDFIRDFHTCPHCDAKMLTYTGAKMEVEHED